MTHTEATLREVKNNLAHYLETAKANSEIQQKPYTGIAIAYGKAISGIDKVLYNLKLVAKLKE